MTWPTRIISVARQSVQQAKPAHWVLLVSLAIIVTVISISGSEEPQSQHYAEAEPNVTNVAPPVILEPHLHEADMVAVPEPEPVELEAPEHPAITAGETFRATGALAAEKLPIAIVIDDLGNNSKRLERVLEINQPLTLSFLSYASRLDDMTTRARNAGYELLVHMPMEPLNFHFPEGSRTLRVGMSEDDLRSAVYWHLSRFDGFVGFNNHMGSKFTADPAGMQVVLEIARDEGLMFLDSRTTSATVGRQISEELGVPVIERHVFLDNVAEVDAVLEQLRKAEAVARRDGHAVAIGHPHDATLQALAIWTANLNEFQVVPLSALVKPAPNPAEIAQN